MYNVRENILDSWSSGFKLLSSAVLVSSQDLLSSIFLNEEMKGTVH